TLATTLVIDNSPPTLTMSQVVFRRIPWGWDNAAAGGAPGTSEYYLLGSPTALPSIANVHQGVEVLAYQDLAGTNLLGSVPVVALDTDPAFQMDMSATAHAVYLSVVNRAGAKTTPVWVGSREWIASLAGKVADETSANPHRFEADPIFDTVTLDSGASEVSASDGIEYNDAVLLTTLGGGIWEDIAGTAPIARYEHAVAANTTGAGIPLFGGCTDSSCTTLSDETWVWQTPNWSYCASGVGNDCEEHPTARYGHAMSSTDNADGGLLLGGCTALDCSAGAESDTWIWDGAIPSWTACASGVGDNCEVNPGARVHHATAYQNAGTDEVVLFGGCTAVDASGVCTDVGLLGDTWIWDGTAGASWGAGAVATVTPTARAHHCMASLAGVAYLFGGCNGTDCATELDDLWYWDDSVPEWKPIDKSGDWPSARRDAALTYNAVDGYLYLMGGCEDVAGTCTATNDLWRWKSGDGWQQLDSLSADPNRVGHTAMMSEPSGNVLIFGGLDSDVLERTQIWKGLENARPAHLARFDTSTAAFVESEISEIEIDWVAGATAPLATTQDGADLWLWEDTGWNAKIASGNNFTAAAPDLLTWTETILPSGVFTGDNFMHFAMTPEATASATLDYGSVATDYIHLIIRYTATP
ncbi:hypothetical protein KAI87_03945, partial [Myxococcota bacterium]|nr:hypothetical protein [Myxococcota bacterium]